MFSLMHSYNKYPYINGGNILSKTINGKTIHYEYSNSFKDELTSYDGKPITYNESGYPVSYMGDELLFDYAGHLTSIKSSGNSTLILNNNDEVSFTYSDTGNRLSKTYNNETVKYIYNNDLLLKEIHDNYELSFIYDYSYNITSLIYKDLNTNIETSYFFTFNNQGDIKAIYRSSDSKLIGTYDYDPYGNIISINDELIDDNDILNKNPIRYRGYYLDIESGLYYVHARYYDSIVGRWISIDDINCLGNEGEILSYNLYAYCLNNPINRVDINGNSSLPNWAKITIGVSVIVALAVTTVCTGGALAVVSGAALSGAVTGGASSAVIGAVFGGTEGGWKGALDGACSGFMQGIIIGGITGAAVSGYNVAIKGTKIIGKAHGSVLHKMATNVKAGNMSMTGSYSMIGINKSLNTMGLKGVSRPDVIGIAKKGVNKIVEVVSPKQSIKYVVNKTNTMVTNNPGSIGKVVKWVRNLFK